MPKFKNFRCDILSNFQTMWARKGFRNLGKRFFKGHKRETLTKLVERFIFAACYSPQDSP